MRGTTDHQACFVGQVDAGVIPVGFAANYVVVIQHQNSSFIRQSKAIIACTPFAELRMMVSMRFN
ncbi:MAG: hypothetical protein R2764_03830 [Bacteroidales bacterium]